MEQNNVDAGKVIASLSRQIGELAQRVAMLEALLETQADENSAPDKPDDAFPS